MEPMRPLACGHGHGTVPLPIGFAYSPSFSSVRSKIKTARNVDTVRRGDRARCVTASLEQRVPFSDRAAGTTRRGVSEGHTDFPRPPTGESLPRWATGPGKYCASWLIPASGFLAIYSTAVCQWLSSAVFDIPGFLAWMLPSFSRATWINAFSAMLAYSGVIFSFVMLPLLDCVIGRDGRVPREAAAQENSYKLPVQLIVPINLALLACACSQASTLLATPALFLGVGMSIGVSGGLALTAAHNLIHSRNKWDGFLADVLLCTVFYMHWSYGHMAHHLQVGTQEDPSSARFGESYYSFVPRSVIGTFKDAIRMERHRLEGHGHSIFSPKNRMLLWFSAPLALLAFIFWFSGAAGSLMLLMYAAYGILLLEDVNYIEHYGLRREKLKNGRYTPVGPQHSWDADWSFTNAVLFKLQRHADHHMHSSRPYQALKCTPAAPKLPASYPSMLILALWPPLWFRVMDPLVKKAQMRRSAHDASRT